MKLYKLEAVRGLAAVYVVLHHSLPHSFSLFGFNFGLLLRFGQEAVILFFILSGFVINYSFQRSSDKSFSQYFRKRFYRLFIPLLFVYALGYLLACFATDGWVNPEIPSLLMNFLMFQDADKLKPGVIASPYMGNTPLWSLSYEWWFYMIYFPVARSTKTFSSKTQWVCLFGLLSVVCYCVFPNFLSRLGMYFPIWWTGVCISQLYLDKKTIDVRRLSIPLAALVGISGVLLAKCVFDYLNGASFRLGVHPVLEMRHFLSAILIVILTLGWRKMHWIGFDTIVKPFSVLAPISYVIYISHHYLVVAASYFSFVGNYVVEWFGYVLVLLLFSYLVEIKLYPVLRKSLTQSPAKSS